MHVVHHIARENFVKLGFLPGFHPFQSVCTDSDH